MLNEEKRNCFSYVYYVHGMDDAKKNVAWDVCEIDQFCQLTRATQNKNW